MTFRTLTQSVLILLVLLSPAYVRADNIVVNGGFEADYVTSGDTACGDFTVPPASWTGGGSAAGASPTGDVNAQDAFTSGNLNYNPHSQACFAYFSTSDGVGGDNGVAGIFQAVTPTVTADYILTYYVQADDLTPGSFYATWGSAVPDTSTTALAGTAFTLGNAANSPGFCNSGLNDATSPDNDSCVGGVNPGPPYTGSYTEYQFDLGTLTFGDTYYIGFWGDDSNEAGSLSLDDISISTSSEVPPPPSTPEPATLLLVGSGLVAIARRLRLSVS